MITLALAFNTLLSASVLGALWNIITHDDSIFDPELHGLPVKVGVTVFGLNLAFSAAALCLR
jgi:hypothetical protein